MGERRKFMLYNPDLNEKMRDDFHCKGLLYVFLGKHFEIAKHLPDSGAFREDTFDPGDRIETHIEAKLDAKSKLIYDVKIIAIRNPRLLEIMWREWHEQDIKIACGKRNKYVKYYRVIITDFDAQGNGHSNETITTNYREKNGKRIKGVTSFIFVNTMHDDWQMLSDEWFDPRKGRPKPRSRWTDDDKELERRAFTAAQNVSDGKGMLYLYDNIKKGNMGRQDEEDQEETAETIEHITNVVTMAQKWLRDNWPKFERLGIDSMVRYYMERDMDVAFDITDKEGQNSRIKIHVDAEDEKGRSWKATQLKRI